MSTSMSETHPCVHDLHPDPPQSTPVRLDWRQADHDVHVAQRAGAYAGFVERTDGGYRASGVGIDLGLHPNLTSAREAVADVYATPADDIAPLIRRRPANRKPRWRTARSA